MAKKKETAITLSPIKRKHVTLTIVGFGGPLVTHRWSEKSKQMMRDKQQTGKKTKERDLRDPEKEAAEACYMTDDGKYGLYVIAVKNAIIAAAHNDLGIPKTLVCKSLFIVCDDSHKVVPFNSQKKYEIGEDMVRVGQGSADLRYRPYFAEWSATITLEIDEGLLQVKDLITLIDWAGSRVGIGEMRPEKGGEYGRFKIDLNKKIIEKKAA